MDAKVCIAGKYRLEEKIGEGGMATVWRAIQEPLDRPVAIKFLHATGRHDLSEMQQRFLSEAKVAAAVHHRNVVNILDFGTTEVGEPFMVMELLEGESLHARLLRDEPMPLTELIRIVTLTLRGLRAVHDAAIVHRDLKPENIFLVRDADGVFPKLLDFGISRSTRGGLGGLRSAVRTEDGLIIGTPQYMSPEQARGCPDIDKRTDIYAVGVILYEALTGRLPFEAEHPGDLLIKIATGERIPVEVIRPDIRPPLAAVINRALEHDRAQRFPNAQAMQKALQKAVAKERGLRGWSQLSSSMAPPWNASLQPMSLAPAAAQLATVPRQSPDAALLESAPTVATPSGQEKLDELEADPTIEDYTERGYRLAPRSRRWLVGSLVATGVGLLALVGLWLRQAPDKTLHEPTAAQVRDRGDDQAPDNGAGNAPGSRVTADMGAEDGLAPAAAQAQGDEGAVVAVDKDRRARERRRRRRRRKQTPLVFRSPGF